MMGDQEDECRHLNLKKNHDLLLNFWTSQFLYQKLSKLLPDTW